MREKCSQTDTGIDVPDLEDTSPSSDWVSPQSSTLTLIVQSWAPLIKSVVERNFTAQTPLLWPTSVWYSLPFFNNQTITVRSRLPVAKCVWLPQIQSTLEENAKEKFVYHRGDLFKTTFINVHGIIKSISHHKDRVREKLSSMYLLLVHLVLVSSRLVTGEESLPPTNDLELTFGHLWDKTNDRVTIYVDISNITVDDYRYYYFDLHPFASPSHQESFSRQTLTDTHNSLIIIGLHENDYVSCVSFMDDYGNVFQPRYGCYEFTLGEKTIGSHHGGSSGYLSPLLVAVVFVIHAFIAVVHHIKAKNYAHKLLQRFTDVSPKGARQMIHAKTSLKKLDHVRPSFSVQRRLSRVSIGGPKIDEIPIVYPKKNEEFPIYTLPRPSKGRLSLATMQSIPEHNV